MMVVDAWENRIVAAWKGKTGHEEIELPTACVKHLSPLD
jgi:hypothetical protein